MQVVSDNFSHQINTGNTVNIAGDNTVIHVSGKQAPKHRESALEKFFKSLKSRYKDRYKQKIDQRKHPIALKAREYLSQINNELVESHEKGHDARDAFTTITNAFEKEGRLLIVGNLGVGKTVLLLKPRRSLKSGHVGSLQNRP